MQEIINRLFNYAFSHNIQVVYTDKLQPQTKSFADIPTKSIVINANEPNKNQLPLIIAHEISHVLQCNINDAELSSSTLLKSKYENKANTNAVKLLIPFYTDEKSINQININDFMNVFAIPNSLKDVCYKELKNYVEDRR